MTSGVGKFFNRIRISLMFLLFLPWMSYAWWVLTGTYPWMIIQPYKPCEKFLFQASHHLILSRKRAKIRNDIPFPFPIQKKTETFHFFLYRKLESAVYFILGSEKLLYMFLGYWNGNFDMTCIFAENDSCCNVPKSWGEICPLYCMKILLLNSCNWRAVILCRNTMELWHYNIMPIRPLQ